MPRMTADEGAAWLEQKLREIDQAGQPTRKSWKGDPANRRHTKRRHAVKQHNRLTRPDPEPMPAQSEVTFKKTPAIIHHVPAPARAEPHVWDCPNGHRNNYAYELKCYGCDTKAPWLR
ncbi:MAG: hypothetical protein COU32_00395 [Candidatus Magasanikbacteria bacterium CG10_big_fil_rev_8_21_14_0_10_42_10]|nr:MAG: hypothetical protein COU32_00395 [Candidatus Magasanikbacteria bacterium CG10_big_fil_rev_8_21_14_0_10_42_10]